MNYFSDVYLKSGKLVDFLNQWQCKDKQISKCAISLALEFSRKKFWNKRDVDLIKQWIEDLKQIGYKFPSSNNHPSNYSVVDEGSRNVNCRRAAVDFSSIPTNEMDKSSHSKLKAFDGLSDWCATADFRVGFPKVLKAFNYIHLSTSEMTRGYYAYYCLAKAKELRLQGTTGYFVMADDATFNFWNEVNLSAVFHPRGLGHNGSRSLKAAKTVVKLFEEKYKNDTAAQRIWKQFHNGSLSPLTPQEVSRRSDYRNSNALRSVWPPQREGPPTQGKSNVHLKKDPLDCFWDSEEMLHCELLPQTHTVTAVVYIAQLQKLCSGKVS
ncbi:unnamed protein product [Heligmosomoides polygyrus]|uniref:DNA-directed DNA polymerase n=1 Tax=Heligmosomoides polygyrus TaxID=6339 RepID=A0A3P8BYE4_HELPZ|nr:unnamed protein product [Heligmosomoides polygyrus]